MPELPEVETVRRGLRAIVGRRIERVEVHHLRSVRRTSPEELAARLEDATITDVSRRGKYLFVSTDGDSMIMIHLRMSG
ncbi:MAG: DNA-formamidopyrimidine glycosylase family protein, partial [Actinomycetota bacterium]